MGEWGRGMVIVTNNNNQKEEKEKQKTEKEIVKSEVEIVDQPDQKAAGRPTKFSVDIVRKLTIAFSKGYNVEEACVTADIAKSTYYEWINNVPGFSDDMQLAQGIVLRNAKRNIAAAVRLGDLGTSRWLLERRDPDFKSKSETELIPPGERTTEQKLKEFMDDTDDDAYPTLTPDAEGSESAATPQLESGVEVATSPTDIS